jgi:hypothetical protein
MLEQHAVAAKLMMLRHGNIYRVLCKLPLLSAASYHQILYYLDIAIRSCAAGVILHVREVAGGDWGWSLSLIGLSGRPKRMRVS